MNILLLNDFLSRNYGDKKLEIFHTAKTQFIRIF